MTVLCCPRCGQDVPEPDLSDIIRFYGADAGVGVRCPGCWSMVAWRMTVKVVEKPKLPRWDELVEAEPRLETLARTAREWQHHSSRKKMCFWYDVIKPDLAQLVGWLGRGRLEGSPAYDVAYDHLMKHELQLGGCRGNCDACRAEREAS